MIQNLPLMPEQASTISGQVDGLYAFLVAVTAFFTLLISFLVVFFAIKYRRDKHRRAVQYEGSVPLEIIWTVIPLGISMVMFVWAAQVYFTMQRPPRGAMEVYGIGKQWMWKFQHLSGQSEINQLHVPVGKPVRVTLIAQDVIHSFYVPAFRVKQDVIPGRYTTTWFEATKPGRYHLFCAEYCGTLHSGMIGEVIAMEPAEFQAWLSGGGARGSLASNGEKAFTDLACITCHRNDSQARGPDLAKIFGQPVKLANGQTVIADEAYIRESIMSPNAKLVAGFQPIMPTFQGQINEETLLALIAYIKSMNVGAASQTGQTGGSPAGAGASPAMSPAGPGGGQDLNLRSPNEAPTGTASPTPNTGSATNPAGRPGQSPAQTPVAPGGVRKPQSQAPKEPRKQ